MLFHGVMFNWNQNRVYPYYKENISIPEEYYFTYCMKELILMYVIIL